MSSVAIGKGYVYHSRKSGAKNSFRYPTFFLFFTCSEEKKLNIIFYQKFCKLLSISPTNYLEGRTGSLDLNIKDFLKKNCKYEAEQIWLHTIPKMLGYVFNPVSFWLCMKDNKLNAVLVEVNNTFGERHFYWIFNGSDITKYDWLRAEKVFHVSPFFPVDGYYKFKFQLSNKHVRIDINYFSPIDELQLATFVQGDLVPLETQSMFLILIQYGWMTPLVIFRIHYQAIKLWFLKTRYYAKPSPPHKEIT